MNPISEAELTDAIVAAGTASIAAFAAAHPQEPFVGLAVETLAEMRYFHLCAQPFDACEQASEERPYFDACYLLPEDVPSNCQEWRYFDFNGGCDQWNAAWGAMEQRIAEYDESLDQLPPDDQSAAWREFTEIFWRASVAALAKLVDSDAVRKLPKASCFVTFIYEHHDVF